MCVFKMGGSSPAIPSLCSLRGHPWASRSNTFALIPTLQHCWLYKVKKWKMWLCNRYTLSFDGVLWRGLQPFVSLYLLDASWAFCCVLLMLWRDHMFEPELPPEALSVCEHLCIQGMLSVGVSWDSCKCSLLALPWNYWDILLIYFPSPPKAHRSKMCFWCCLVSAAALPLSFPPVVFSFLLSHSCT